MKNQENQKNHSSDMELKLHRRFSGKDYTVGALYVNGAYFCDTLEDADRGLMQTMPAEEIRRKKVTHETAIPTGVYRVTVTRSPAKRRMLPRLLDVPGFSGILIHRGNTKNDSSGCILVGENRMKGKVINSTPYETRLVEILTEAQEHGEEITIEIE
ncbi:MAG: DUF5675 family protein [Tannerella sp.]|nr:DUF5675 family protein [Tannerella sp.]